MNTQVKSTGDRWLVDMSDADRRWLRGLLYGVRRGFVIGRADMARAREMERELAPKGLRKAGA